MEPCSFILPSFQHCSCALVISFAIQTSLFCTSWKPESGLSNMIRSLV